MAMYYFLATALPALQLGIPPEIDFYEFQNLLVDNLSEEDYAKSQVIRRFYDIQNIRSFWKGEPLDPWGNLVEVELEEALLEHNHLPQYVFEFLEHYTTLESRLHNFPELVTTYFRAENLLTTGFLKNYLLFEREWRLVLAGFRAKQLGRDLLVEMQFEDPDDDFVAQIIAQKDSKDYIPPDQYLELKPLFETYKDDPLALHQALCEYRFKMIEEMLGVDVFSIDFILGYMAQLIIIEKWQSLDRKKGLAFANQILEHPLKEKS